MKMKLSHVIVAIVGLGLAAVYGGAFRLYTFIKFIPTDKWLASPYMVAVTLSVFAGLLGAAGLIALAVKLTSEINTLENTDLNIKVNRELEQKIAGLVGQLDEKKEEAFAFVQSFEDRKKEGEEFVEGLFEKKAEHEKEMLAKKASNDAYTAAMSGRPGAPKETSTNQPSVNVSVKQGGCGSGCAWAIFILAAIALINTIVFWTSIAAFF